MLIAAPQLDDQLLDPAAACPTSVLSLDWGHDAETPEPRYECFRLAYPSGTVVMAFYAGGAPLEEVRVTHPLASEAIEDSRVSV